MLTITPELLIAVASMLVAGGAAWGGARSALNGTRKEVKEIKETLSRHEEHNRQVIERLTRVETKLETK